MDKFKNSITSKVLSNIPLRVKPIDYLMEALNISRESVYRRIRGDISFTFEEMAKLSVDLGFSIDELVMKNMPAHVFFELHAIDTQDPSEVFLIKFKQYFQNILNTPSVKEKEKEKEKEIESIMVSNRVPLEFIILFDNLFKFSYYRWMHQFQEISLKYSYSDVIIPEELACLQHKAVENLKKVRNSTFIFDSNIFLNLIREIQYYYKRRLINEDDFLQIKDDLTGLVDMVESVAQTGFYVSKTKFNFYLSSLNIESNSRFTEFGENMQSQFFIEALEPITVLNQNLCVIHKRWLDSMRKYSTLISLSNEILQAKYFNRQRVYIDEDAENVNLISL